MNPTLYVTLYEHRHGTDVAIWPSEAAALAFRDDLSREQGAQELPDEPLTANDVGETYFDIMGERLSGTEYFAIYPRQIEQADDADGKAVCASPGLPG